MISDKEKQATLVSLRRTVLAAMETGQQGKARTVITELAEYDLQAARALRAEVVSAYGVDI